MSDLAMITETIRQSTTGVQIAEALGLKVDGHGRCACPIHNGKDRNMKLWKDDSRFYCHVCHTGGDGITLVQVVNQCSFRSAIEWINGAFHLGLSINRTMDENAQKTAEIARKRRQLERWCSESIDRMEFDLYCMASKLTNDLENDMKRYRPTRPYRDWDARYAQTARMLLEAREMTERMVVGLMGAENGRESE